MTFSKGIIKQDKTKQQQLLTSGSEEEKMLYKKYSKIKK